METTHLQSHEIALFREGDDGTAFHELKNGPKEVNRPHILERRTSFLVHADLIGVFHGTCTKTEREPSSLIIMEFSFRNISRHTKRRIRWARIDVKFQPKHEFGNSDASPDNLLHGFGTDSDEWQPEVTRIEPDGFLSLYKTKYLLRTEHGVTLSLGVTPLIPLQIGLELPYLESRETIRKDSVKIYGDIIYAAGGTNRGPKNAIVWTFDENQSQKSGIPSRMRTAIVIKRPMEHRNDHFYATVEVHVEVDVAYAATEIYEKLAGLLHPDDSVVFDPTRNFGHLPENVDLEDLSHTNLLSLNEFSQVN